MPENTPERCLDELRRQFDALEQAARANPGRAKALLPGMIADLHRSLEALRTGVAGSPPAAPTSAPAHDDVRRARYARSGRGLRIRATAERGPVMVRVVRAQAHCRWANRAWLDFTGRSVAELLGDGWLRYVHPEDRERCLRVCRENAESGRLHWVEYRLQRDSGEYGWVLEIGAPRVTSRGRDGGYLGTAVEITEHKQAEAHLALQYAVAHVLSEAESLEESASAILQTLCEGLGWDVGELWTVDAGGGALRCAHVWSSPSVDATALQNRRRTRAFPAGACPPWQGGTAEWIADIALDDGLSGEPEARILGLHGMLRLPVAVRGEIHAILRVFSRAVRNRNDAVAECMRSASVQIAQFLEHRRSVQEIRESEARKSAILEASLDAVITIDERGRVLEFNAAAESIFGYPRDAAVGSPLASLIVPARMREQALAEFERFRNSRGDGVLGKRFAAIAMKSDGSEFPVDAALAPVGTGTASLFTLYINDATARTHAEHEVLRYQGRLRSLMADLLLTEEQERRRLAADLHDGLSQTIALTRIKLAALRKSMDGKLAKPLDEIESLIDQTNRAARSITFELSPPVLHDLGLEPAVQWLVENIQDRYGIEIVLEDDGRPKPADEKTRVILFRSIRELLINAAKHARARHVHVKLQRAEDQLEAVVEDDGVGMEPDFAAFKGSGLLSIRERLSHVGGNMRIESANGGGTRVRLCAPLVNRKSTKAKVEA